jgi:pimeloyl-ACP methyl ester carboxylesterase
LTRIIHMRGDVTGMLILFVVAFLGIWQIVVAYLRLNGLSLTGYPDRRCFSKIIGAVLVAGSCSWYFSKPGHFASPDVEGIETLILLLAGIVIATALQVIFAGAAHQIWHLRRRPQKHAEGAGGLEELSLDADGTKVGGEFRPAAKDSEKNTVPVLLLHDYGSSKEGVRDLAGRLAAGGHPTLTFDLDGHGGNPRHVTSPAMEDLLGSAVSALRSRTGEGPVAAVGVGLGGILAMDLLSRGVAERAVAIDPPARDEDGYGWVNVLRELGPFEVISAFFKPPARGPGGKRISLNRLLKELPPVGSLPPDKVRIIGTSERWFNSPVVLGSFAAMFGVPEPVLLPGNHSTVSGREETVEATLESL